MTYAQSCRKIERRNRGPRRSCRRLKDVEILLRNGLKRRLRYQTVAMRTYCVGDSDHHRRGDRARRI